MHLDCVINKIINQRSMFYDVLLIGMENKQQKQTRNLQEDMESNCSSLVITSIMAY